jgi:hypothetical protein
MYQDGVAGLPFNAKANAQEINAKRPKENHPRAGSKLKG